MKNIKTKSLVKNLIKYKDSIIISFVLLVLISAQSCSDYLDVVPDNVSTIDKAFNLRNEAQKYLYTCYSYLPKNGDPVYNIAMLAGDEIWMPEQNIALTSYPFDIANGFQRNYDPYVDVWEGKYAGAGPNDRYQLFDGIRHCNIFIDNLEDRSTVPDIEESERLTWIAEAKFLKAYYHFYLMRMYGPIPIIRKNVAIDASEEELYVFREPVDDVVSYIIELLDEATLNLPTIIRDNLNEYGRIDKSISAALKAKVLLTAASPLFNGNTDMSGFNNNEGIPFFNQTYNPEKWKLAADAAKIAIDFAKNSGHDLYTFSGASFSLSDNTLRKLSISGALTERQSNEVIWPNTQSTTYNLQLQSAWPINDQQYDYQARKVLAPTFKMAKMFYSKNGVPIDDDKTLDFSDLNTIRTANQDEKLDISEGYKTARINFDREPRFYADLAFDGSVFYIEESAANEEAYHLEAKYQDFAGSNDITHYNVTGYYLKKLVNYKYGYNNNGVNYRTYAWPEIRLAELYLIYAEASNEVNGPSDEDIFTYLDLIRDRAGLKGVKESWTNFSKNNPNKFDSKEGLRDIIHQERAIELAFEGKRYWDLRRWKTAIVELNKPIQGWNYKGETVNDYYQINTLFQQRFIAPRDYFWPVNQITLRQNPNLVQNPGWE